MFIEELPFVMLRCLIITIIIEVLTGLIIGIRDKKDLLNIVLVNILTNPVVVAVPVLILLVWGSTARWISLAVLEILTVIVEGFIYFKVLKYRKINGFLVSLILNLASYGIGELLNRFVL